MAAIDPSAAAQIAQAAVALLLVLAFLVAHRRSPSWGMALVWMSWLFVPFVRRLIEYAFVPGERDVLSLLPFALTGLAAILALRRSMPTRRAWAIVLMAAAMFLIGVIPGLSQPFALAFALVSYGAALSAAAIGWTEAVEHPRRPLGSLGRVLLLALPVLGIYSIVQYFQPALLPWDALWAETSGIRSLLTPEEGRLRTYATLNSPLPAAATLGVALLVWLRKERLSYVEIAAGVLGGMAFALTYVRSAWVGIGVAVLVLLLATRDRVTVGRTAFGSALAAGILLIGSAHPTVQAIIARIFSIGAFDTDVSARARGELIGEVLPGTTNPDSILGHGLGQAGLASDLGGPTPLASADNGYLAILYQSGFGGLALLLVTLAALLFLAARNTYRGVPGAGLELALVFFFIVLHFFNDALYGMRGVMLWYVAGRILAGAYAERPKPARADAQLKRAQAESDPVHA
ncbi:MAG: O-antigen ligase family protein [Chloroflexi bacterium]|nr:O-antigen ligase family protein [Chloroflexota bacterium]